MHSLKISNLSKSYDGVQALEDVSLTISPGIFGLLGPNDAGKSTLMRTVVTLQAPDGGSVRFDGVDVVADPEYVRRRLGYLPREFGVYPHVSALFGPPEAETLTVAEIPSYGSQGVEATTYPSVVFVREHGGFTGDFGALPEGRSNYLWRRTAHELAHQWWGGRVDPDRTEDRGARAGRPPRPSPPGRGAPAH